MGNKTWLFTVRNTIVGDTPMITVDLHNSSDDGHEFSQAILTTFFTLMPYLKTLSPDSLETFSTLLDNSALLDFTFIGDNSLYSFDTESDTKDTEETDKPLAKTGMGSSATFISNFPLSNLYRLFHYSPLLYDIQ
jgi:hypothetical protein